MIRSGIIVLTLATVASLPSTRATAAPPAPDPLADNAALAYWQAFILMPKADDGKGIDADAPIDAKVIAFVDSGDVAVGEMKRAAKMDRCVWGADLEAGIEAQLPYLSQARNMARFACLRARVRFSQNRPAEAIDELVAVMAMARHAGSDGLLISLLVQYAIDNMAVKTIAEHLPALQPEHLDKLSQRIEGLPEGETMSQAMRMEKAILLEWFIDQVSRPGGKEQLLGMLKNQLGETDQDELAKYKALSQQEMVDGLIELRAVYDQLIELLERSPGKLVDCAENLIEKEKLTAPAKMFASFILPAVGAMRRSEAPYQTRQVMLKAAIAVVKGDESQLKRKELHDPYGDGPFEYAKTKGGFTLRSKLLDRQGKPVVLRVGPASDE